MTTEAVQSRVVDQPVFFPPDEKTYFGFATLPAEGPASTTAVILLSGTHTGSTTMGRNRMWVKAARTLAGRGYPTIRIDYAGLGESLSGGPIYDLELPAVHAFNEAVEQMRSYGASRFVVVGTCFGSRTAIAGAVEQRDIAGLLLLAPPVRNPTKGDGGTDHLALYASTADLAKRAVSMRTIRKLLRTKKARSVARRVFTGKVQASLGRGPAGEGQGGATDAAPGFLEPIKRLVQRGVPIRIVYGESDIFWTEFQKAAEGRLGQILERAGDLMRVETVPGIIRGFTSVRIQEACNQHVLDFVEECTR